MIWIFFFQIRLSFHSGCLDVFFTFSGLLISSFDLNCFFRGVKSNLLKKQTLLMQFVLSRHRFYNNRTRLSNSQWQQQIGRTDCERWTVQPVSFQVFFLFKCSFQKADTVLSTSLLLLLSFCYCFRRFNCGGKCFLECFLDLHPFASLLLTATAALSSSSDWIHIYIYYKNTWKLLDIVIKSFSSKCSCSHTTPLLLQFVSLFFFSPLLFPFWENTRQI